MYPDLIDFVAGYPGPAEAEFNGGLIRVVSILLYGDGLRIEWRMRQAPDLTWLDTDVISRSRQFSDLRAKQMWLLWETSSVSDDHGSRFQLSLHRATLGGPWEGEAWCTLPSPPLDARQFTLHIGGADIVIPCKKVPRTGPDYATSEFVGGYQGPKQAQRFHGGAIKLISTLLYKDNLTIEWLMRPVPDLSWLPGAERLLDPALKRLNGGDQTDLASTANPSDDAPFALWLKARLADDQGTNYVATLGHGGTWPGGYRGELRVSPSAPSNARELHLTLHDMSVFLPLVET